MVENKNGKIIEQPDLETVYLHIADPDEKKAEIIRHAQRSEYCEAEKLETVSEKGTGSCMQ